MMMTRIIHTRRIRIATEDPFPYTTAGNFPYSGFEDEGLRMDDEIPYAQMITGKTGEKILFGKGGSVCRRYASSAM